MFRRRPAHSAGPDGGSRGQPGGRSAEVVVDPSFDWRGDLRPMVDWDSTVLYELHVKGFTQLQWRGITPSMFPRAGLDEEEAALVTDFLMRNAADAPVPAAN